MASTRWLFGAVVTVIALLLLWGVSGLPRAEETAGPAPREYDPLTVRPSEEGDVGRRVYHRYCAGCHGVNGDGKGPAARFLKPKPRDFTKGVFKFVSTTGNAIPPDEDLLRTVTEGLRGTSMPAWRLLPLNERLAVVRYVKSFYKEWEFRTKEPPIPFYDNPFDMEDPEAIVEAVSQGEKIYHALGRCWACHPAYLSPEEIEKLTGTPPRPNVHESLGKPDFWGEVIKPPDFRTDVLKSVRSLRDLYRVITAGVGGTAMPSWRTLSAEQLWALTLYVDSLRPQGWSELKKDPAVRAALEERRGAKEEKR